MVRTLQLMCRIDMTILIKEENGRVIKCPTTFDSNGDCYFMYDSKECYLR